MNPQGVWDNLKPRTLPLPDTPFDMQKVRDYEKELIDRMRDAFPKRTIVGPGQGVSDHSNHIHVSLGMNKTGHTAHTEMYDEAWGFADTRTTDNKESTMNRTQVIAAELARLQDELAQRSVYGEDEHNDGAVLRFSADFNGAKKYLYAAIKAGGKWHLTGSQAQSNLTWSQLVDFFISSNTTKVWKMEKGERIV